LLEPGFVCQARSADTTKINTQKDPISETVSFIESFARKKVTKESEESKIRNLKALGRINLSEKKKRISVTPRTTNNGSFEAQK